MCLTMVYDHGTISVYGPRMKEMAISQFKARCLAVLEQVRKTKRPIRVTRFGEPIAEVVPPSIPERPASWLGTLAATGRIPGDVVAPVADEGDWEVLRS
jgi:prevent-host-death family protein